jgi:hypothetical protein
MQLASSSRVSLPPGLLQSHQGKWFEWVQPFLLRQYSPEKSRSTVAMVILSVSMFVGTFVAKKHGIDNQEQKNSYG